jgi:hypothetical protein
MNIFKQLFFKSRTSVRPLNKSPKEYTFSMTEMVCIRDRYTYKVKAESKEEAFKKLVMYFFSTDASGVRSDVESEHNNLTNPYKSHFSCKGMPYWFAKRLSGEVRDIKNGIDNQHSLEVYCKKHGIELDKNN